ncbi:MAG TPA: hypothetical protein VJA47_03255 [archaeon]|nr:hypothetical protein [archaeon]
MRKYFEIAKECLGNFGRAAVLTTAGFGLLGEGCGNYTNAPANQPTAPSAQVYPVAERKPNKDSWEVVYEKREMELDKTKPLMEGAKPIEDLDTSKLPFYGEECKRKGRQYVISWSDNRVDIFDWSGFYVYSAYRSLSRGKGTYENPTYVWIPDVLDAEDADGDGNFELIARGEQTLDELKTAQQEARMKPIRAKLGELRGAFEQGGK